MDDMAGRPTYESAPSRVDFALVPVLDETRVALVRILSLTRHEQRAGYLATWGVVEGREGDPVSVVVGQPLDRENLAAGSFVSALISGWRPANLLLVDIGGGVKGRDGVQLGDVVVHTTLHYYDFHKIDREGQEVPRYLPLAASSSYLRELSRRPAIRRDDAWQRDITSPRIDGGVPIVRTGEILSGGALLARSDRLDDLLARHDKVVAVEMEGAGAGRGVLDSGLLDQTPEFLIVRGISDFCNDDQQANQETRDQWRGYAAEAAAAHAAALLREIDPDRLLRGPPHRPPAYGRRSPPTTPPLIDREPGEPFNLRLDLQGELHGIQDLRRLAIELRRIVVLGRAGAGKTVATARVLREHGLRMPAYFVGRPGWLSEVAERLPTETNSVGDWRIGFDVVLRGATTDVTVERLAAFAPAETVMLVVDALNAAPAPVAARVLDILDEAVRHLGNLAVIVSDRAETRYPPGGRWTVARVAELGDEVSSQHIDKRFGRGTWASMTYGARKLLNSPFFLELALRGADLKSYTRSSALRDFVAQQARLNGAAIAETVEATADAYRAGTRALPKDSLSPATVTALDESGIASAAAEGDLLRFTHELFGDYFASLRLITQAGTWRPTALDAITFSGDRWQFEGLSADTENFDAVTLAAEQMAEEAADEFLRAVYDWNWRAAVDCLAVTDPTTGPFSAMPRTIVLALLNERRTDPVDGTRRRAERLLETLPDPLAQRLALTPARQSREIIRSSQPDASLGAHWLAIYCREPDEPWTSGELKAIADPDTLLGWTVSYVLKRDQLTEHVCDHLMGLYRGLRVAAGTTVDLQASIRWRVVHSLAAGTSSEVLEMLLEALDDDPYPWVRWGAARSVTEFAARAADYGLTRRAVDALTLRAPRFPDSVSKEIAWASQYHGANELFPAAMRPLLEVLSAGATGQVARARWDDWIKRFDRFWDPPTARSSEA